MVNLGFKNGEITDHLLKKKVYGDNTSKESAIYKRINCFKKEKDNVECEPYNVRSSISICGKTSP